MFYDKNENISTKEKKGIQFRKTKLADFFSQMQSKLNQFGSDSIDLKKFLPSFFFFP